MLRFFQKKENIRDCSFLLVLLTISGIVASNTYKKERQKNDITTSISIENEIESELTTTKSNEDKIKTLEIEFSEKLALHILDIMDSITIEKIDKDKSYIITEYDSNNIEIRKYRFKYEYVDLAQTQIDEDLHSIFTKKANGKAFTK